VWPMISAGSSNSDIQYARDIRPFFDEEESAAATPEEINATIEQLEQQQEGK